MNLHHCRTCAHWEQKYPENKGLGDCMRINVLMSSAYMALTPTEIQPPIREQFPSGAAAPDLRTVADFGCVCWTAR
jgi:hypothetical protein